MIRDEAVRRLALALPDVEEGRHGDAPTWRCYDGRIATLFAPDRRASVSLSLRDQAALTRDRPGAISPVPGGFGRMGHTYVDLARVDRATMERALFLAWKERSDKRGPSRKRPQR